MNNSKEERQKHLANDFNRRADIAKLVETINSPEYINAKRLQYKAKAQTVSPEEMQKRFTI
jgi:hypothetical protein